MAPGTAPGKGQSVSGADGRGWVWAGAAVVLPRIYPRLGLSSAGHWRGQSLLGRVDTAQDQAGETRSCPRDVPADPH